MNLYILTGQIQTGKTTWLKAMLQKAKECNIKMHGVLTPAIFEDGIKTGIEACLLPSEKRFLLAKKIYAECSASAGEEDGESNHEASASAGEKGRESGSRVDTGAGEKYGTTNSKTSARLSADAGEKCNTIMDGKKKLGYNFDNEAIKHINAHLHNCEGVKNLVIDEIGPLEMLQGKGYVQAMELLDKKAVQNAICVVRPSLLDEAKKRWGQFETLTTKSDIEQFLKQL